MNTRRDKIISYGALAVTIICFILVCNGAYAYDGPVNVTTIAVNDSRVDPSAPVTWTVGPVNNGTTGNPVQNGFGMYFDGAGDFLTVNHAATIDIGNGSWTVSFWLKNNETASRDLFVKQPAAGWFLIRINQGGANRIYTQLYDGVTSVSSEYISFNNRYSLVTVTIDRGTNFLRLYVNGTQVDADSIVAVGNIGGAGNLNIMNGLLSGGQARGTLDELHVFNRTLGTGEINYLYNNKVPLDQTGLNLWLNFDTNVLDQTPNGNDATINGNPQYVSGIRGKAGIVLDGTGDYITVTGPFANGAYSYSTWIKILDTGNQYILDATGGGGTGTITWNANTVAASSGTVYVDNVATTTLTPNVWHFLSVRGITLNAPVSIILGADNAGANTLNGTLDHGSLYNRTITLAENTEQYQGNYNNTGRFCLLDYDNNVNDQSGSGNNGATSGDPEYSDGLANCPLTSSYNGVDSTTSNLVNSTTGLITLYDTAPAIYGTYNVTIYPPTLTSVLNGTFTGFIVDLYNIDVYALFTEVEAGFQTLIYANGSSVIDGHTLGPLDTLVIEGVTLTWNTYMARFEATDTEATATIKTYDTLTTLLETTYGITNGNISTPVSVIWTTPSLDLIMPFMRSGDWPGAIIEINILLMGQTLFWTLLMASISMAIYNYSGAETAIAAWILGWGIFSPVIHGEAVTISLIMIALAGGIYIAKFFLDRRTSV